MMVVEYITYLSASGKTTVLITGISINESM